MTDSIAVVTGANGGIGRETVQALLGEGRRVAAFDLETDHLDAIEADDGQLLVVSLDVTDSSAVDAAFSAVAHEFGEPEALINIAGTNRILGLLETSDEMWDFLIDLNLKGTFLCCRAAVPYMQTRGGGRIINMSSIFGIRGEAREVAYSAAKGGIVGLTRALATELAPDGITVNALAPVMTLTPRVAALPKEFQELQRSKIPLGRFGTVSDVVGTVTFLLSEAGSFYSGQTFSANGGDTMP